MECRVVRKIESSRRAGKSNGRFSNFHFPNACKIDLRAFREASTFIRVDSEMRRLPAYFDNPGNEKTDFNHTTHVAPVVQRVDAQALSIEKNHHSLDNFLK